MHFYEHYFRRTQVDKVGGKFQSRTSINVQWSPLKWILSKFYQSFYVNNRPDNYFVAFSIILSFFLIFENQGAAGNVIQLIKKKPKLPMKQGDFSALFKPTDNPFCCIFQ